MIKLICGEKGSGKTKKMLEMANQAVKSVKGEIVFVDAKRDPIFELHRDIRFVNVHEFSIKGVGSFFGFINGLIAENYDIDEIYVDNLLNITGTVLSDLEHFFTDLIKIGEKYQVHFVFSVNLEGKEVPSFITDYIVA